MTTQMTQVLRIRPKALPAMSIQGALNRTRLCMTPSQPQNSPLSRTACLPLRHKPNPRPSPNPPTTGRSDQPARCRHYHSEHVSGSCALLLKLSDSGNDGWTEENMAELEGTGVGFGRATSGVIIGPHTYLPKSSLGRGTTGRDPESRTQRNHW